MKQPNAVVLRTNRDRGITKARYIILMVTMAVLFMSQISYSAPKKSSGEQAVVLSCRQDLAKRLSMSVDDITLKKAEAVQWPDTSLGMAQPGMMYAQVVTPGYKVVLEAKREQYLYHTSATAVRFNGAVNLWSLSVLCVEPRMSDANMNGDLYQVSLFGGNRVKLGSDVSQVFPQNDGLVAFTTRTSRSGFDLAYFDMKKPTAIKPLTGAFAFGGAAVEPKASRWAAFIRPMVGMSWQVSVGELGKKSDALKIDLPAGVKPDRIAFQDKSLNILVWTGEMRHGYTADLTQSPAVWKAMDVDDFPGFVSVVLNKSQNLDVEQTDVNGVPTVDVANLWFTGTRDTLTTIPNMKLGDYDMISYRYVMIAGQSAEKPVLCVVDIANGMVSKYTGKAGSSLKLFLWPAPQPRAMSRK
ncbi:MAG: hypothetical protein ACYC1M_05125 [Armatimonadota bacterium]